MIDELARVGRQCLQVAHADRQFAQRPGIGEADRAECHVAFGPLHGGLPHAAYATIACDPATDGVEAPRRHAQPQWPADAFALSARKRWIALARSRPTMS